MKESHKPLCEILTKKTFIYDFKIINKVTNYSKYDAKNDATR